jgi:chromosome segregation ATPase
MAMDEETLHAILIELEETKAQNDALRKMNRAQEMDIQALKEELHTSRSETRFAIDGADELMATHLREFEHLRQRNDCLARQYREAQRIGSERENAYKIVENALKNRGDDLQRATERKDRLEAENLWLREQQGFSPKVHGIVKEMIVTLRRTTTLLLRNQGVDAFTDVPDPKSWHDVEHMLEAIKHALNDSGIAGS